MGYGAEGASIKRVPSSATEMVTENWFVILTFLTTIVYKNLVLQGMFDTKADLSAFHIGNSTLGETEGTTAPDEGRPNPKLGMAPLSSEIGHSTGASQS